MGIGLPRIEINFKQLAASIVSRSARGIVALIVKDDTKKDITIKEYRSSLDIESADFTPKNIKYIKDVFLGVPSKVFVIRVDTTSTDVVKDAIQAIGSRKYNWIGLAEGTKTEHQALTTYIKEQEAKKKTVKAVVYNPTTSDSMHVVNFTNESVTYKDGETATGDKYIARLLGIFAGLPMTRSGTYLSLPELNHVVEPEDVEEAINAGQLVLINDDETVRIGRGVNSLSTLGQDKTPDMQKIIIVESMDMILEDIYSTFKNEYLGKYKNKYDNQVLLISAINSYFDALADEDILDSNFDNKCQVDIEAQRAAWLAIGKTEAQEWDDTTVKNHTFRSNVYLSGKTKILDAIEDFTFNIDME